jgi:hypothetical protein
MVDDLLYSPLISGKHWFSSFVITTKKDRFNCEATSTIISLAHMEK